MLGGIFEAINISSQGLSAQRKQMEATVLNIANVNTTRTEQGGPYQRRKVITREVLPKANFGSIMRAALEAEEVIDQASYRMVYDPTHPDANEDGYVAYPHIDVITEMVNMVAASRIYDANVTAINAAKGMIKKALEI